MMNIDLEKVKEATNKAANNGFINEETQYIANRHSQAITNKLLTEITLRTKYTRNIFYFTCSWVLIVMIFVYLDGVGYINISDTIVVTLITSTTLNVFGFFTLVLKYLFNPSKST